MKISTTFWYFICLFIFLISFILNSCKKDTTQSQNLTPTIEKAKSWYENLYLVSTNGDVKQNSLGTQDANAIGSIDFTKFVKPNWYENSSYSRFGDDVIEMPIDGSTKVNLNLRNDISGQFKYEKNNSKSSFLLLNHENTYNVYIMTIIADSSYLKNDLTKLDRNKYNKRDSDFSGVVLYFTPKGEFVNGWFYKGGIIKSQLSPDNQSSNVSTVNGGNETNTVKANYFTTTCTDWYQTTYYNNTAIGTAYLGRICQLTYTPDGSGGSGGSPGTGSGAPGGGSGGGAGVPAPTPNPCTVPRTNSTRITVNTVTGPPGSGTTPDGDGFPPPTTTKIPCPTSGQVYFPAQDIVTDSLSKYPCAKLRIIYALLSLQGYANFVEPFCSSTQKPSITWQTGDLAWNSPAFGIDNAYQLAGTMTDTSGRIGQSSIITLNTKMLKNSSELMVAAAAIHETLHAYINYNIATAKDQILNHYRDPGNWFSDLDAFYSLRTLPPNYRDHYEMLTDYFNQAVSILSIWDNNRHTAKECKMAMLYGLTTASDADNNAKARINQVYNDVLTAAGITQQDLNSFYQVNVINAPSAQKIPTSGCN
jgi:uncharacterized membrane protein YgcG